MAKIISITFPNQDVFGLPAEVVAKNRTEYYKSLNEDDFDYDEEFKRSMEEDELLDWIGNNMNWVDVKDHAVKIQSEPNYDNMWNEATFKV